MTEGTYHTLTIAIERVNGAYRVTLWYRNPHSAALVAPEEGRATFDQAKLSSLQATYDERNDYGRELSRGLFADERILQHFDAVEHAAQGAGSFLRVVVRIHPSAMELHALRWEWLAHPRSGEVIATKETMLLSRFLWSRDLRPVVLRPRAELKALVAVSAPDPESLAKYRVAAVDFEGEVDRARRALVGVEVRVLGGSHGPVMRERLCGAVRDGVDVVYLVSHGMRGRKTDAPGLLLQDGDGKAQPVTGEDLAKDLAGLPRKPRLVILAACHSAEGGEQVEPTEAAAVHATVAGQVASAGVPAVIGMQGLISMRTVDVMMPVLFSELLRDGRIDRALAVARREAVGERGDWWMPALYSRLEDCRLWPPEGQESALVPKASGVENLGERPPVFEGRDDELARIREALAGGGTAAVFSAVVGLGGVGKSRLALEYAFEGEYDVRWWVRASEVASLHEDLVRLGRRLGILGEDVQSVERAVEEVFDWLSTHERWLLVLDDAENSDKLREASGGRLSRLTSGHVLITSRAQAWRSMAKPIELTTLLPEAAKAVLLERSGRQDDGFAGAVAEQLGYLPLALIQAGAYVEATGCLLHEYLGLLERHGIVVFRELEAAAGYDYESTVAATWEISLAAIQRESPAAAVLLDWLAFLDPDGVPLRLLRERTELLPKEAAECVGSSLEFGRAIAVLRRYSMVERVEQPEDALRVHRLVQAVTRDKLGDERRRELAAAVATWVKAVFGYQPEATPIKDVPEGIGEQLMAVGMLKVCVATSGHLLTWELHELGNYYIRRGMLSAARVACERSLQVAEGLAVADGKSALVQHCLSQSLNMLGLVEMQAGNLMAARELLERSLSVAEGLAKADEHSAQAKEDLSVSLEVLGDVEVQAGNHGAAREHFQRSLETREDLAKADRASAWAQRLVTISLDKLGNVEVQAGNLVAARRLFQRSLETREGLAKAGRPSARTRRDLSVSLNKLGVVELHAGNLGAARELFQRSLVVAEGLEKADGRNAKAQRDLSVLLEKLGNVEVQAGNLVAARELVQRCTAIRERLAKADGHSAQAQRELSVSLVQLGTVEAQAGNLDALREVVATANERLDAMDAKGQITGYQQREQVRLLMKCVAEELAATP